MPDHPPQIPLKRPHATDLSPWAGGVRQSVPLACALRLFSGSRSLEVTTSSVSCEGFTFTSAIHFEPGEQLHGELGIQSREPGGVPFLLSCRARVLRVDGNLQGGFNVACDFEEYVVARPMRLPDC